MSSSGAIWRYEEEKAFENAIAMHWIEKEDSKEQWEKIASSVPNKSMEQMKQHYQVLVDDVSAIEEGHVSLPNYANELDTINSSNKDSSKATTSSDKRSSCNFGSGFSGLGHDSTHHSSGKGGLSRSSSSSEQERRKGIPWTEEEHRCFIITFTLLELNPSYNCSSISRLSIYLSINLYVCLSVYLFVCHFVFPCAQIYFISYMS
jgi:hypothetical protein